MPIYSYICNNCEGFFEMVYSYKEYDNSKNTTKCPACSSKKVERNVDDMKTLSSSVKKSDTELKTLGDLALRNTDRMSDDQKQELNKQHNAYKEQEINKPLPKGMSRMKKTKGKTKWY